jgi:hypothetical protein
MAKRKPTDIVPLQVRMPEALRQSLAAEAERNKRSLNSEILWRLGQTMEEGWQKFIAEAELRKKDDDEFIARMLADPKRRAVLDRIVAKLIKSKEGGD